MANQYLDLFNTKIEQNTTFIHAMADVVEQYSSDYWDYIVEQTKENQSVPAKDHICFAVEKFYDALFDVLESKKTMDEFIGQTIIGYNFGTNMPQDFMEVVEAAKKQETDLLIKLSKERAPSKLVADCENTAAAKQFSAKVIFAQTVILERALKQKTIKQKSHIQETEAKITEWINLLYTKFAEMILESNSLDDLKSEVDQVFKSSLVLDGSKLQEFKLEIDCQIEFLEKVKFFEFYYEEESLADKYDFIYEAYQDIKQKSSMTPELKMTLSSLFLCIVNKAYQPMDAKKFELMSLRNGTVENVFNGVRSWVKKHYANFKEKDLYDKLVGKLQQEEEAFKKWEEISHRILDNAHTYRTYQPLMRDLYTMKYAGDPNQDPQELLSQLPKPIIFFPRSPVKSNQKSISMQAPSSDEKTARLENSSFHKTFQKP